MRDRGAAIRPASKAAIRTVPTAARGRSVSGSATKPAARLPDGKHVMHIAAPAGRPARPGRAPTARRRCRRDRRARTARVASRASSRGECLGDERMGQGLVKTLPPARWSKVWICSIASPAQKSRRRRISAAAACVSSSGSTGHVSQRTGEVAHPAIGDQPLGEQADPPAAAGQPG